MGKAWHDLSADGALAACIGGSFREVYGYVGLLAGHDTAAAEHAVTTLFERLAEAVDAGSLTSVSLSRLRGAARTLWLDRQRLALLAQVSGPVDEHPAATLADLSDIERVVTVLRFVNAMPAAEAGAQLELTEREVDAIERRAIRRLAGERATATDLAPRLTTFFSDSGTPRDGFREELVSAYGGDIEGPTTDGVVAAPEVAHASGPAAPDDAERHEPAGETQPELPATEPLPGLGPSDPAPPADPGPAGDGDAPTAPRSGRRRRVAIVLAVALVGALVAGLAWGFGRGAGDGEPESSASTSGAVAAAASSSLPTTVPAPTLGFDPVCVERAPAPDAVSALDEGSLNVFGPLGAEPNLVVDLPASVTAAGVDDATATVLRVVGGVVVTVRSNDVAVFDGSVVASVDATGAVRWVRCFVENVIVRSQTGPVIADAAAISVGGAWKDLSLADGSVGADVAEPPAPAVAEATASPDPAVTPLVDARLFVVAGTDVTVVFGCIAPDPAAARGCATTTLRGYSADGTLRWQRAGVLDVAAVQDGYALILYAAPGADPAWYMIQIADGTAVEGQVWGGADTFANGCCATTAPGVELHGGVVVLADYGSVSVWYPAVAGVGAASASLAAAP